MDDVADAAVARVINYTVGFAIAGGRPAVRGSGVLIKYHGQHGILTAAHVDEELRKLTDPIGVVQLNHRSTPQHLHMDYREIFSHSCGYPPWEDSDDLAFIPLMPDAVAHFMMKGMAFIDWQMNISKTPPKNPEPTGVVIAVFGLIDEYSSETFSAGGRLHTPLRAVFTPGNIVQADDRKITFETLPENFEDLPQSFGGYSGGGIWRLYITQHKDRAAEVIQHQLLGIAYYQTDDQQPKKILCQPMAKIDLFLSQIIP